MATAKSFRSGNSQVLRLPNEFRFKSDRVEIFRRGDEIVLKEAPNKATVIFDGLVVFPTDFMPDGREDLPPPEREPFCQVDNRNYCVAIAMGLFESWSRPESRDTFLCAASAIAPASMQSKQKCRKERRPGTSMCLALPVLGAA